MIYRELFGLVVRLLGLLSICYGIAYLTVVFKPAYGWDPYPHLTVAVIYLAVGTLGVFKAEWIIDRSYRRDRLQAKRDPEPSSNSQN